MNPKPENYPVWGTHEVLTRRAIQKARRMANIRGAMGSATIPNHNLLEGEVYMIFRPSTAAGLTPGTEPGAVLVNRHYGVLAVLPGPEGWEWAASYLLQDHVVTTSLWDDYEYADFGRGVARWVAHRDSDDGKAHHQRQGDT